MLRSRLPGPLAGALDRLAGHLFVGLPPDPRDEEIRPGEYLVRQLMGIDAGRGALVVAATVRAGDPLYIVLREGQVAREDLKEMLHRLGRAVGRTARFGFFGNAEIAPLRGQNRLFTYTGVLALIGEGAADGV